MTTYPDAVTALNALLYTGGRGRITPENMATAIVGVTDALKASLDEHADIIPVVNLTVAAALTGLHVGDIIHVENNGASKWARYQVTSAGDGTWSGASKTLFLTQDQAHTHLVADLSDASAAARTLLQQVDAAAMRTALGLSTLATGALPGAAGLLAGEEGIAIDFLTRTAYVNDYANTLTDSGRPIDLLTVTRASTKLVVGRDRLLTSVAANTLGYAHDPSTGAPRGVLTEGPATNQELWSRDLTNAAWTKTSITATKDQTGADGSSNAATRLAATGANGTCLQALTLASAAYTKSAYVKRVAGTGTIQMTMDNGATWTAISITSTWTRYSIPSQTLANPTVGFRIVTSGDEIAVDYSQTESGPYASSPIATTSATAARSADVISIAAALFPLNSIQGTLFIENELLQTRGASNIYSGGLSLWQATDSYLVAGRYTSGVSSSSMSSLLSVAAVNEASLAGPSSPSGVMRSAVGYRLNDVTAVFNGGTPVVDTSAGLITPTQLYIGCPGWQPQAFGATHIRRVAYLSRKLTDAELIRITAL